MKALSVEQERGYVAELHTGLREVRDRADQGSEISIGARHAETSTHEYIASYLFREAGARNLRAQADMRPTHESRLSRMPSASRVESA